jgi:hypothetical protein
MVKCPLLIHFVLSSALVDYTRLPKRIDSVFISPVSRRRDKSAREEMLLIWIGVVMRDSQLSRTGY